MPSNMRCTRRPPCIRARPLVSADVIRTARDSFFRFWLVRAFSGSRARADNGLTRRGAEVWRRWSSVAAAIDSGVFNTEGT